MITEKSNRLQVIMITDYDYPISATGWPESTLVKMPHCWKSHVTSDIVLTSVIITLLTCISYITILPACGILTNGLQTFLIILTSATSKFPDWAIS